MADLTEQILSNTLLDYFDQTAKLTQFILVISGDKQSSKRIAANYFLKKYCRQRKVMIVKSNNISAYTEKDVLFFSDIETLPGQVQQKLAQIIEDKGRPGLLITINENKWTELFNLAKVHEKTYNKILALAFNVAQSGEPLVFDPEKLPACPEIKNSSELKFSEYKKQEIARIEKEYIVRLLKKYKGSVKLAAQTSGLLRPAFSRLIRKHNISAKGFK